jgi:hydroxymethylpyrimidine kinase/phosphomethylpyrimidine kinase/thiamine-phosphate diphosphorylase
VITPNRDEALALLGRQAAPSSDADVEHVPDLGLALQAAGALAVLVTGGDARQGPHDERFSLDWLSSPEAEGWLCAPRVNTPHHHGSGCTLASTLAAALAIGHAPADACVLGRMVVHHALMNARAAGQGRGPVVAQRGALAGPAQGGAPLPWLGIGRELPWRMVPTQIGATRFAAFHPPSDKLYGILPDGASLVAAVEAGLRCVQLRHKAASGLDPALTLGLQAAARHGAALFVNDHWRAALGASLPEAVHPRFQLGIHLGQEDLLALSAADRAELRSKRGHMLLGLSSHCPWELARALGCGPSYVACGPIQATTTKDMPWLPQGEGNLRWWISQADVPVVAIGGLVTPEDLSRYADCNPAALCVARALQVPSGELSGTLAGLRQAARRPPVRLSTPRPKPCLP